MTAVGFTGDIKNQTVFKGLDRLKDRSKIAIRSAWFEVAKDLSTEANKEILRKPKGGHTYFIRMKNGRYRRHVASAPGETHANLTGKLRRSVSWKVHGFYMMEFGYGFATGAKNRAPIYDSWVEDGHKQGKKRVAERPSMGNAVKTVNGRATNQFDRQILREFQRVK
jgi:hypothetical protein